MDGKQNIRGSRSGSPAGILLMSKHSKPVAKNISSRKIKIFASLLCFFVEIVSLSFAFYGP